jgi:hypothetical protein
MGGLGHGDRAHSSNEYVTLDGMKQYEKWDELRRSTWVDCDQNKELFKADV